jgi:hypothetical protein
VCISRSSESDPENEPRQPSLGELPADSPPVPLKPLANPGFPRFTGGVPNSSYTHSFPPYLARETAIFPMAVQVNLRNF